MKGLARQLKTILDDHGGSMTVEFVATTPFLLAALVFSFEFSRLLWAYDVVSRDIRSALRYTSRAVATAPPTACPVAAQNIAQTGDPLVSADGSKHFPWRGATPTFACATQTYNGFGQAARIVTMTASVNVPLALTQNLLFLGPASFTLSVSDQARLIGS